MNKQIDIITDLLVDFDEMGFCPTTSCPDPDAYAIEWRNKMTKAIKGYRTDVAREIFAEIDESFSQMIEEAENTIADAIQEENRSVARIAQYGRDVLILARNTLEEILKKKYESEGADDENLSCLP